ncbi:MAG: hypothetical protein ABR999_02735 [Methanoregula sp.]|uniref:hypothetical protein n=1 Tax=Methanoregula sp. TaxID=2052170 RepID=UPI003D09A6FE
MSGDKTINTARISNLDCEIFADHREFHFYASVDDEKLEIYTKKVSPTIFNEFLVPSSQFKDNQYISENVWDQLWEKDEADLERIVSEKKADMLQKLMDCISAANKRDPDQTIELRDCFKK